MFLEWFAKLNKDFEFEYKKKNSLRDPQKTEGSNLENIFREGAEPSARIFTQLQVNIHLDHYEFEKKKILEINISEGLN